MRIALDTTCIIAALSGTESDSLAARELMAKIQAGQLKSIVSSLVFGEVITFEKSKGPSNLYAYFAVLQNVQARDASIAICEAAGMLRRENGKSLKLPDAIHLATALETKVDYLVTSDKQFAKIASKYLNVKTPDQVLGAA